MRKILFICPKFRRYEQKISCSLSKFGSVDSMYYNKSEYYRHTRVGGFLDKFIDVLYNMFGFFWLLRLRYEIKGRKIRNICDDLILFRHYGDYTNVIVIKGDIIDHRELEKIKRDNPKAILTFYQWDSFELYKNEKKLIRYFDRTFSFQLSDAKNGVLFLPNPHFCDNYRDFHIRKKKGVCFVGGFSFYRLFILLRLEKKLDKLDVYCDFSLFTTNRILNRIKYVTDVNIDSGELENKYLDAGIVLDMGQPYQEGVTQRFFEALSLGCYVITTNKDAIHFENYRDRVCLINDFNNISDVFEQSSNLIEIDKFHVDHWSKIILGIDK